MSEPAGLRRLAAAMRCLLEIVFHGVEAGLRTLSILLGGRAAYADGADMLAASGLDRYTAFESHQTGHERDARNLLCDLAQLLGGERELGGRIGLELRNLDAAEKCIVLAQEVLEISTRVQDGDVHFPALLLGERLAGCGHLFGGLEPQHGTLFLRH